MSKCQIWNCCLNCIQINQKQDRMLEVMFWTPSLRVSISVKQILILHSWYPVDKGTRKQGYPALKHAAHLCNVNHGATVDRVVLHWTNFNLTNRVLAFRYGHLVDSWLVHEWFEFGLQYLETSVWWWIGPCSRSEAHSKFCLCKNILQR